jgi:hypothetical protein
VVSTIGTPIDVTAQELRVEAFFPADDQTRDRWTSLEGSERASSRLTTHIGVRGNIAGDGGAAAAR